MTSEHPQHVAPRRVFISAAAGERIRELEQVVRELGHVPSGVQPAAGTPYGTAVIEAVRTADLVVVVLPGREASASPFVEAGAALALDKPMLLISPSADRWVPSDLKHLQVTQADLDNRRALRTALSRALGRPTAVVRKVPDTTRSLGNEADQFIAVLRESVAQRDEGRFSRTMLMALSAAGLQLGSQARVGFSDQPDRADFVGWSDTLGDVLGNPFVIELKIGLPGPGVVEQLRALPRATGVQTVLLLIGAEQWSSPRTLEGTGGGSVLVIDAASFLEQLRVKTLAEALSGTYAEAQRWSPP